MEIFNMVKYIIFEWYFMLNFNMIIYVKLFEWNMWNFILYLKDFPANEAELIRWVLDGITPHYGKGVAPHAGAWIETVCLAE